MVWAVNQAVKASSERDPSARCRKVKYMSSCEVTILRPFNRKKPTETANAVRFSLRQFAQSFPVFLHDLFEDRQFLGESDLMSCFCRNFDRYRHDIVPFDNYSEGPSQAVEWQGSFRFQGRYRWAA